MTFLRILEISGVSVAAAGSVLISGRKNLDLMGVVVVAIVSAIGGGMIRDLLLNRHPIFWIENPIFLYWILGSAAVALLYVRLRPPPQKLLLVADALSLALFTLIGTQITEQMGHTGIVAAVMGVITGCAGGILRDVLCNEIPLVMRGGRLYATAALAGATLYLLLRDFGVPNDPASIIGMSSIAGLRGAAIIWGISLPEFRLEPNGHGRLIRWRQPQDDKRDAA